MIEGPPNQCKQLISSDITNDSQDGMHSRQGQFGSVKHVWAILSPR